MDKLMRAVTALGQLAILWALCLLGEQLAGFLPLPGAILAMVVLLILLCTRVLPRQAVGRVGDFFQRNMAFFVIPSGVAIVERYGLVRGQLGKILLVMVVTIVLTYGGTALTIRAVTRWQGRRRRDA